MNIKNMIGKKIVKIRPMTEAECFMQGWDYPLHSATSVVELDDGTTIFPSMDDEGNGAGTMLGCDSRGGTFYVYSHEVVE